jgi:hypothetical protein
MTRAHSSGKLSIARDAIDVVLRRLLMLPSSPEIDELLAKAEFLRLQADAWTSAPPSAEDRERLMKVVLQLHTDVTRLEQETWAK